MTNTTVLQALQFIQIVVNPVNKYVVTKRIKYLKLKYNTISSSLLEGYMIILKSIKINIPLLHCHLSKNDYKDT